MSQFAVVRVGHEDGKITCDQPEVQLYLLPGPRAIAWVFDSMPPDSVGVAIEWQGDSPFRSTGMTADGKRLVASGIKMVAGHFKYSILFFDRERKVIAKLDPVILVDPDPPGWP